MSIHLETKLNPDELTELQKRNKELESMIEELSEEEKRSEFRIRGVYDLMSGYLESYVEQVILKGIVSRYRPNIRMNNINILKEIQAEKVDRLMELYEKTSRLGSRHSQPDMVSAPTYDDLTEDVKILQDEFKYTGQ